MAARKWTQSQKEKQRLLIQQWQPWQKSTGAKSIEGKAKVSLNALKSGEFTAAALQADREHRQIMREHHQNFNEFVKANQEYLDLVAQHEYLDFVEKVF